MIQTFINWIIKTFFQTEILPVKPAPVAPIPDPVVIPPVTPTPTPVEPPKPSRLSLWVKYIALMEGAKPDRNNPGNLRFVGQANAIDDNGFCKFTTLADGENALEELLTRAASGKSSLYPVGITLYEFQCIYSPASDGNDPLHYSTFVAAGIATVYPEVTKDTQIKNLIS